MVRRPVTGVHALTLSSLATRAAQAGSSRRRMRRRSSSSAIRTRCGSNKLYDAVAPECSDGDAGVCIVGSWDVDTRMAKAEWAKLDVLLRCYVNWHFYGVWGMKFHGFFYLFLFSLSDTISYTYVCYHPCPAARLTAYEATWRRYA